MGDGKRDRKWRQEENGGWGIERERGMKDGKKERQEI